MCGFCAVFNLNNEVRDLSVIIQDMNNEIIHRGPDDEGYLLINDNIPFIFKGDDTPDIKENNGISYYPMNHIKDVYLKSEIALGFRRLAIQDLSQAGHQPMSYLNRYWIVFNGEIYNFPEIKQELESCGYNFSTKTDAEVIMAVYDKWGSDCLNKFNGMWAFIIYDIKRKSLFISRDRFGIKPLNYYLASDVLILASEIKSILKYPNIDTSPNMKYIDNYLKAGGEEHIKETSFNNIY